MIRRRLGWLWRRQMLMRSVPQFHAEVSAFCDSHCRFEGYNRLYRNSFVFNSRFGHCSYVADFAHAGAADVGRFVSIGPWSIVGGLGRHPVDRLSTHPTFYSRRKQAMVPMRVESDYEEFLRTTVGPDVWIGARAIIRDGVTLAPGTIVAAGAVVNKDTEAFSIVGGVPARLIRFRFPPEKIARILADPWWDWSLETIREKVQLFSAEGHHQYD